MMKSKTIKKLYTLHSWVGIVTGILLFVIAFTGAVSVFSKPELRLWGNPEVRSLPDLNYQKVEDLVAEYAKKVPDHYREEVMIFPPSVNSYTNLTIIFESHHGDPNVELKEGQRPTPIGAMYQFDPHTYELVFEKQGTMDEIFNTGASGFAYFLVSFHADLHLGRPIGLLTTGVLGLTMMLSIVTGIFIHRKILGQLFTFRPQKTFSLMLTDSHKVIGVWGLLFNSVIAFTGAFLGLAIVVLVPAAAFVSFGGDQEKLIETFTAVPEPVIQHVEQPTQIAKILEHANLIDPDAMEIGTLTVLGYNDASAIAFTNVIGGESVATQLAVYQGSTGELKEINGNFGRLEGASGPVLDLLFPLHFGNFGGILVKVIWGVLGIGTALLPLTGMMLWIERGLNSNSPKYSERTYQRFSKLVLGSCGGIVIAVFALFPAQMIIKQGFGIENVTPILGYIFYPLWLVITVAAMIWPSEKSARSAIFYLCAAVMLSIMPINIFYTGSHVFNVINNGHYVSVGIDLVMTALGIYLLHLTNKMQTTSDDQTQNSQLNPQLQGGA
ncbi:PepSY domain-containing protein [Catenovulum sp. SM1970]|uniref:PepSY-associated TM helix domain-containing protein n=1 Tax=Marinifaba aquimaris TaxID=2741323 RepID=UPI001574792A|nr:PepSY-associated TM helix domain-containing protein [Marinifaba aquimaris]NTS75786.1 PepSY domain-containing protein [Marinifaba aquimaris]